NAAALVRPPFDVSRVQPLIEMYMGTHLGLEEIASTQSATALSFSMTYPESTEQTHEDRLNEAYKGLSTLIEKLNAIENGTWKGWD
ncbi:MAG TPA: hypothetical protein VFI84_04485, partial [Candidatus Saccharimonadales bacterium]|nr:hypothetical protein [Candidatus Saccharimonadales bacterium]